MRAQRQLSSSGSSHVNVVGHASGSTLNELSKNGHHAGHSLLHNTGSCNSVLGCPIYIGNARAKKAHGIAQVQLLLNWVNGYYILVSCGACGIRISVARHDKLRYRLGWISTIVGKKWELTLAVRQSQPPTKFSFLGGNDCAYHTHENYYNACLCALRSG